MGAGALQHRAAQGGVSAGVGDDLRHYALDDAVFIAAQSELHLHGVALGVDKDALGTGQLDLYGPFGEIRDQSGVVLDSHVLLTAEAAAHQAVADLHLVGAQAQHPHDLVLGIVGALVRGEDHHAVFLRICHSALRLQKGVLRPGGGEPPGQNMLGFGDGQRGVSPLDVLVGQQVALLVDQGCVGEHGLPGAADHGKLLVIHLHQRLGLGQNFRSLGGHQANRIA